MFDYILIIILAIFGVISAWRDYHPKIESSWSVRDIFMTYPPTQ